MDILVHGLGVNATIIAQIINLFLLLLLPGLTFLLLIGGIIYSVITISNLKKRIEKLEEQLAAKTKENPER